MIQEIKGKINVADHVTTEIMWANLQDIWTDRPGWHATICDVVVDLRVLSGAINATSLCLRSPEVSEGERYSVWHHTHTTVDPEGPSLLSRVSWHVNGVGGMYNFELLPIFNTYLFQPNYCTSQRQI